jgi:hypothetical protein
LVSAVNAIWSLLKFSVSSANCLLRSLVVDIVKLVLLLKRISYVRSTWFSIIVFFWKLRSWWV